MRWTLRAPWPKWTWIWLELHPKGIQWPSLGSPLGDWLLRDDIIQVMPWYDLVSKFGIMTWLGVLVWYYDFLYWTLPSLCSHLIMVEDWRQSLESVPKSLIKFGTANLESSSIICVGPEMGHPWNQPVKLSSPVSLLKAGHRAAAKPASRCFSCLEAQDLAQKGEKLPLGYHSAGFFWVDFWGGELFSLLKLGMLPHRFVYKTTWDVRCLPARCSFAAIAIAWKHVSSLYFSSPVDRGVATRARTWRC